MFMASGPITSWEIDGETVETVSDFIFWGAPKSLQMVTAAMKLKDIAPWKKSYDQPRKHIQKQRHYFANKGSSSQGYGFSCGHVWMWELDCGPWREKLGPGHKPRWALFCPAVTREQSPALTCNSNGRLDFPGPTQEETCIPHRNSRILPQLEKKHVGPPSALDEALAHYSISREVPGSVLMLNIISY